MLPRWQRRHPLTQPKLPFAFLRALADGVGASVCPAHGEGVCGTSRHDQRHVGIRFGRRIRHLGHLHNINRFFKSRRYGAGDLLSVAEHRLIHYKGLHAGSLPLTRDAGLLRAALLAPGCAIRTSRPPATSVRAAKVSILVMISPAVSGTPDTS